MAIECCHAQRVYTVLVGKLGAVVVRDGVEYQLLIAANLTFKPLQGMDCIGGSFTPGLDDDFTSGFAVCHYKATLAGSFGLAYDAIQFPMSNFFTISNTLCAVFNTAVFWVGHVGMGYSALSFLWVTLWQVLIAQAGKQLHLYISVACGLTDGHAVVIANLRYCILRTGSGQDVRFQRGQIVRTITNFQVRAVGTFHIVSAALCLLRGVDAIIFPCVAAQLVHHAATKLAADGGRPDADLFCNRGLRETELVQVFY